MAAQVGLWIDHRKAVIVSITDGEEETRSIESQVGKHVRYSGRTTSDRSHEMHEGAGEDTRERRFSGQLDKYYDEVIEHVRDAEAILIFGPGEAKGQLKARLEHHKRGDRIVAIETVDKMTDRQIAAKVRERFAE